jgi:monoamine oxidase
MENVIIIGAGLSGLSTAYQLKKAGIGFKILEAQSRVGGRIETIYGKQNTPMEMGATWFGNEHTHLIQLLTALNIAYFEQHTEGISLFETMSFEPPQQYFVPANSQSAYRVKGGTFSIIEALYQRIGKENVVLNTEVIGIIEEDNTIKIIDRLGNNHFCKRVIIALPPKVAINAFEFTPKLSELINQVMQKTQTWMSGSVKFSIEYKKAFWKDNGFSGSIYSQSGLATEIYDHSNYENSKFALKGFLNGSAYHYSQEERKEKVIAQLKHYFGEEAGSFESYHDKIWNDKYIQPKEDAFLPPHYNNGHTVYADSYLNGKLFFTGTETSNTYSGYMEGAIIASNAVAKSVLKLIEG